MVVSLVVLSTPKDFHMGTSWRNTSDLADKVRLAQEQDLTACDGVSGPEANRSRFSSMPGAEVPAGQTVWRPRHAD